MAEPSAVIFDVDGVLLEMTRAEEDTFFIPFARRYGLAGLSRDWASYRIRNDEDIVAEIFARHGLPDDERPALVADYLALLTEVGAPAPVPGVHELLQSLSERALGIATANFREAARLRLAAAGLWQPLARHAFGAEGGGHKSAVLARAMAATGLPASRIVYVGDNLTDLQAGLANGVHFIGFSQRPDQLERLRRAGARHLSGDHATTAIIIGDVLK